MHARTECLNVKEVDSLRTFVQEMHNCNIIEILLYAFDESYLRWSYCFYTPNLRILTFELKDRRSKRLSACFICMYHIRSSYVHSVAERFDMNISHRMRPFRCDHIAKATPKPPSASRPNSSLGRWRALAELPVDSAAEPPAVAVAASGVVDVAFGASGLDVVVVVELEPPAGGAMGECDIPVEIHTIERTTSLDDR